MHLVGHRFHIFYITHLKDKNIYSIAHNHQQQQTSRLHITDKIILR